MKISQNLHTLSFRLIFQLEINHMLQHSTAHDSTPTEWWKKLGQRITNYSRQNAHKVPKLILKQWMPITQPEQLDQTNLLRNIVNCGPSHFKMRTQLSRASQIEWLINALRCDGLDGMAYQSHEDAFNLLRSREIVMTYCL